MRAGSSPDFDFALQQVSLLLHHMDSEQHWTNLGCLGANFLHPSHAKSVSAIKEVGPQATKVWFFGDKKYFINIFFNRRALIMGRTKIKKCPLSTVKINGTAINNLLRLQKTRKHLSFHQQCFCAKKNLQGKNTKYSSFFVPILSLLFWGRETLKTKKCAVKMWVAPRFAWNSLNFQRPTTLFLFSRKFHFGRGKKLKKCCYLWLGDRKGVYGSTVSFERPWPYYYNIYCPL